MFPRTVHILVTFSNKYESKIAKTGKYLKENIFYIYTYRMSNPSSGNCGIIKHYRRLHMQKICSFIILVPYLCSGFEKLKF